MSLFLQADILEKKNFHTFFESQRLEKNIFSTLISRRFFTEAGEVLIFPALGLVK